jgi:hypothetical protein
LLVDEDRESVPTLSMGPSLSDFSWDWAVDFLCIA